MIRGVIGPDEYHNLSPVTHQPGLDNNAYTNLMAVWTLTLGLQVLDSLPSGTAAALRQRLQLSDTELDIWRDITRSMYLPIRADGVLAQFDDAEQLERAPDAWRAGDRPRLDWMLEARGDRADDYRLAKQADVLMLLYLFPPPALQELLQALGYGFDQQALRRTAAFHLGNITHESSLSTVVCAGALACFDPQTSWDYFQQSMGVDLNAPSGGGTQEGIHLGAMAGSLDVLQRHYLGIRPGREWLDLFPAPPPALGEVRLAVRYRGAGLQVLFRGGELRVRAAAENARAIAIRHPGGHRRLAPGEVLTVRCAGA